MISAFSSRGKQLKRWLLIAEVLVTKQASSHSGVSHRGLHEKHSSTGTRALLHTRPSLSFIVGFPTSLSFVQLHGLRGFPERPTRTLNNRHRQTSSTRDLGAMPLTCHKFPANRTSHFGLRIAAVRATADEHQSSFVSCKYH